METEEVSIKVDKVIIDNPERHKAALYQIDNREIWIPYSVHEYFDDGTVMVQEWWAIKEELI